MLIIFKMLKMIMIILKLPRRWWCSRRWPSPDNPRGRRRDRAHPREADRDHQPRLGLRSSRLHTGLKISLQILDHGIAGAWQHFDHDRWSLWPCTLTSAPPSSGPSGSSPTMSKRTRSASFYHNPTLIKSFKPLNPNQQTFFLSKRTASLWAIPRQSWTCSTRSSSPSSLPSSSGGSRWPACSKYWEFLVWILVSQSTISGSPTPYQIQSGWDHHISACWLNSKNTFTKEVRLKARSMQKLQRKSSTVWRLPGKLVALNWGWVG